MNLLDPSWDVEAKSGAGLARVVRLGHNAGAKRLGASLIELETGAVASPLHFHHGAEELLFVIAGTPSIRRAEGDEQVLETGAVVSFPPGREGAHQIVNRAEQTARVLICSTNDLPEVAEQLETGITVVLTSEYDRYFTDGVDAD